MRAALVSNTTIGLGVLVAASLLGACSSSGGDSRGGGAGGSAAGGAAAGGSSAGTAGQPGGGASGATGGTGGATGGTGGAAGGAGGICASCDASCEESVAVTGNTHVEGDIDYGPLPPAGGDHNPCWADWGVYDTALPAENWVHNLEHGGVVFAYSCPGGCDADVAALAAYVDGRAQAILTPYPDMDSGFAVVSWGHRLVMSCLDLDAMSAFYDAHVDDAPESVTSGKPSGCP